MAEKTKYVGPSIPTLLCAAFVFCKLAGLTTIATWSWWLVFAPLWVPVALILLILLLGGIASAIIDK